MSVFHKATLTPSFGAPSVSSGMWKPTGKPKVHIIDLYHEDDVNSWEDLSANASAGIHKVATGRDSLDPKFPLRWPIFTQYNMRRGFYQWFLADDGAAQFDYAWAAVQAAGGAKQNDRIFALDYEP